MDATSSATITPKHGHISGRSCTKTVFSYELKFDFQCSSCHGDSGRSFNSMKWEALL